LDFFNGDALVRPLNGQSSVLKFRALN
jgi:hypothetical protein